MDCRFYIDPDTDQPHIYNHGVAEHEVEDVMQNALEDRPARNGTRESLGRTQGGRYLRVVYVPDDSTDSFFIITAIDMRGNELRALRRRQRRRR